MSTNNIEIICLLLLVACSLQISNAISCYECDHCNRVNSTMLIHGCTACSTNIITKNNVPRVDARFCLTTECKNSDNFDGGILYTVRCCSKTQCNRLRLKLLKKKLNKKIDESGS